MRCGAHPVTIASINGGSVMLPGPVRVLAAVIMAAALVVGCAKSAAQRIDEAAALIGRSVNAGADDVKSTLGTTIRASDDEALAVSLERMVAAEATWQSKAWNAAKATVQVARSEPVSVAADLVCEGLERWDEGLDVTVAELETWAVELSGLPSDDPDVATAVGTAVSSLEYHGQGDRAYIAWVRDTACLIDALP